MSDQAIVPVGAGAGVTVLLKDLGGGVYAPQVATMTVPGTLTDRSGTLTTGGTSQQIAAANTSRRYFTIQNLDPAQDLWVNCGAAASVTPGAGSFKLFANGGSLTWEMGFIPSGAIHVVGAVTGQPWTAKEGG